ncbi:hypothetical protein [Gluconobacter frateurii]|uniref:CN hydrolase domain-containing protein n=1 Tax=Gluconobacter frateurii NRIC 0228 TaxID=1307946 RepID=A0ABQ0QDL6_9PROT|nr:hypothetical protein [Gluconobacter frateurii]GBR14479.1 hypothetical protein AA0228_2269 [Gluconobacter frateurii NRIC 0228]GLP90063.1 hypothetical protein GCM10007868_11380 [Gluconobacter frateurii]
MNAAAPPERSPATLFVDYHSLAASWTASQRAIAPRPDVGFADLAADFLARHSGAEAHDLLKDLVEGKIFSVEVWRGRILAVLQAIDHAFYRIHPRAILTAAAPPLPDWLRDARFMRRKSGAYLQTADWQLIARGPLLRASRNPHASNADLFSDYFAALTVAPRTLTHDGRAIRVEMKAIPLDPFTGVPASSVPGSETVGFVPLAITSGDLIAEPRPHADRIFARYGPAPHFDAGAAALAALTELGGIDIAVMPELAMNEAHHDWLADALAGNSKPVPKLIVAGSCNSNALSGEDQPWNETRVLNARGTELWRQRKLWPAGVDHKTAAKYGIDKPDAKGLTLEDNAAGDTLVVADLDGLGRCVILICQDCEMPVFAPAVVTVFQPDWIFTPIFDCSIDAGRWAHARAFGLSNLSQARCLAVTNMAFAGGKTGMGLAVGPKETADGHVDDVDRAMAIVEIEAGAIGAAKLQWRAGVWHQSWLSGVPARLV